MSWLDQAPLRVVYRRRENDGEPVNDRRLRSRVANGEIVRIAPGSYADAAAWRALRPIAKHAQRVWEASARLSPGRVFSHFSAAALLGIDILGSWPAVIDTVIEPGSGGRSSGGIRRHARSTAEADLVRWRDHWLTTPLQTASDLIAAVPFLQGVVVADQSLWNRRSGGPLVVANDLRDAARSRPGRGSARARRAADFATDAADSVRESQSRVVIATLGFPPPLLQVPFMLKNGRTAFTDFFWEGHRHIGEFDGLGKYRDPALLAGRTPEEVLVAEKDREDDLRRQVHAFSRWRTPALESPRLLYDILTSAGLPSTRPRPGR